LNTDNKLAPTDHKIQPFDTAFGESDGGKTLTGGILADNTITTVIQ